MSLPADAASPLPARWRLNPLCRITWKKWGRHFAVYDDASGQTHLINDPRYAVVLQLLAKTPLTFQDLAERLVTLGGGGADEGLAAVVAELDQLGLIDPVTP